jgi:hypothetical protein
MYDTAMFVCNIQSRHATRISRHQPDAQPSCAAAEGRKEVSRNPFSIREFSSSQRTGDVHSDFSQRPTQAKRQRQYRTADHHAHGTAGNGGGERISHKEMRVLKSSRGGDD